MKSTKTISNTQTNILKTIDLPKSFGKKHSGKVRDFWIVGDRRITVTTDRQSAFDVILGHIPYKGAVLNQLAAFWFEKTKKIAPNHMISVPDPNVLVSKQCEPIPVEMVVRGYMSGVTKTSIWYSYQKGERKIYGVKFPNGMKKNEKFPKYVITPTTHPEAGSDKHDERLTRDEIIRKKIVDPKLYKQMEEVSLKLFDLGTKWCAKQGLILVDTKYEFGLHEGKLVLIDEIHTPDSSRFWIKKTYKERLKKGEEPENFDKEFMRLWYAARGYTGDGAPPKMTPKFIKEVEHRYIAVYEKITGKKFKKFTYPIKERIKKAVLATNEPTRLTYAETGDNYDTKDPIKKLAQVSATRTGENLKKWGFAEIRDTRGESGYVWKQGNTLMAAVAEQLGTKNLVADAMREVTGKTYYDVIAHDTVATIINDLTSTGAQPLVLHAYWAIENNDWLADEKRMKDLIRGWKSACDIAGASWGGGETPTLKGIISPGAVALGGSAIGYIKSPSRLITDKNLKVGDRILLLKSTGINANGLSLARAIAKKLPKGYATKMANGQLYGDGILKKTNIYTRAIQDILNAGIPIHYISNITGHGFRKLMRARGNFSYVIEKMFPQQELFNFIQKHANLTDRDMYDEFNMGNDYAIYLSEKYVKKAQAIVKKNGFQSIDAGYVDRGPRRVVIKPKNITFDGDRLDLR